MSSPSSQHDRSYEPHEMCYPREDARVALLGAPEKEIGEIF